MNKYLFSIVILTSLHGVLLPAMQSPSDKNKMPADLLKGCGAVASKEYTCRACTPEEVAVINAQIKLKKILRVKEAIGGAAFEKMSEEEVMALHDKACHSAAKKIVEDGGCKQQ